MPLEGCLAKAGGLTHLLPLLPPICQGRKGQRGRTAELKHVALFGDKRSWVSVFASSKPLCDSEAIIGPPNYNVAATAHQQACRVSPTRRRPFAKPHPPPHQKQGESSPRTSFLATGPPSPPSKGPTAYPLPSALQPKFTGEISMSIEDSAAGGVQTGIKSPPYRNSIGHPRCTPPSPFTGTSP